MQLSKHFTLSELTASTRAEQLGISNQPNQYQLQRLKALCTRLLEPIRQAWNSPIKVTSGFRCEQLNTAVKGAKTSAHRLGYAADLVPVNGDIAGFKSFVKAYLSGATFSGDLQFDQCIDERNAKGSEWIHLGLMNSKGEQRGQFLITTDGKTYKQDRV